MVVTAHSQDGAPRAAERPIALVGMMGAGKSAVGRLLAARLGRPFADSDELIQAATGRSIAEIFATEGEAAFRARERRFITELPAYAGHVLALGGGMFVGAENVARIRAAARTVWLRARVETLLSRLVRAEGDERPLVAGGDAGAKLLRLLAARASWYAQADMTVDTDDREPAVVAALIAAEFAEPCA